MVDSLRMNEEGFKWVHNMLAYAHLDNNNALSQDSLWENSAEMKSKGIVAIGQITYRYDRFVDEVVEDSLIYYDGAKFQNHPNAVGSPFTQEI